MRKLILNGFPYTAYNSCLLIISIWTGSEIYVYIFHMWGNVSQKLTTQQLFITNMVFTKPRLFSGNDSLYFCNSIMAGHRSCHSTSSLPQLLVFHNHSKSAQDTLLKTFVGFTVNLTTRWLEYLSSILPVLSPQITGAAQNSHIWVSVFFRQFL